MINTNNIKDSLNLQIADNLRRHLFSEGTESLHGTLREHYVYAIVDGAALQSLYRKLHNTDIEYQCLYTGFIADELEEVAPYLVALDNKPEFTDWLLNNGYGKNCISFIRSNRNITRLTEHFRNYTLIDLEQESPDDPDKAFYAFYDPRVVEGHMSGMSKTERKYFFKPLVNYSCENINNPSLVDLYTLSSDHKFTLTKETLQLTSTMHFTNEVLA